ncbi:MAG: sigma-70 family RNA polymerase sigma factor [Planctomycetota bacterium]|nr:sigma-70 family RNA polymerase sigma factor [Planctomycetota bacterium]
MKETVEQLLARCRSGDQPAADELFSRYSRQLLTLAERQIGEDLRQRLDPDDITQTVFRTFFRRNQAGEITVDHESRLWRLLVTITLNKVRRRSRDQRAARRDPRSEIQSDLTDNAMLEIVSQEPTPLQASALTELIEATIADLDESENSMFRMCLEGFTTTEIADSTGVSRWTVRRLLDRVGYQLEDRIREEPRKD